MRGDSWTTIEEPLDPAKFIRTGGADDVILLDCATLWLTNLILGDHDVPQATTDLIAAISQSRAEIVIVSNEVGYGIYSLGNDTKWGTSVRDEDGDHAAYVEDVAGWIEGLLAEQLRDRPD